MEFIFRGNDFYFEQDSSFRVKGKPTYKLAGCERKVSNLMLDLLKKFEWVKQGPVHTDGYKLKVDHMRQLNVAQDRLKFA